MSKQSNELKKRSGPELVRQRELQDHERAILASLRSFIELGRHLGAINRDRLYRDAGFERFEDYVESRFDISRQHAYRLIEGARAALTVSPNGDKITSEAAARELVPLSSDPDKMRAVFAEAEARVGDGRITAAVIRDVREEMFPGIPVIEGEVVPPTVDPVSLIPEEAKRAIEARSNRTTPADRDPEEFPADSGEGSSAEVATTGQPEESRPGSTDPGEAEDPSSAADAATSAEEPSEVAPRASGEAVESEESAEGRPSDVAERQQERAGVSAPAAAPERSGGNEERGQAAASVPAPPRTGETDEERAEREVREYREARSLEFATGLVNVRMRLEPDPVHWYQTVYIPGLYHARDLPRVRDSFTPTGLRQAAGFLLELADHLDEAGEEL